MASEAHLEDRRYTYGDYVQWSDDERWELIDGVPYAMSPAPSPLHQEMLGEIFRQIANALLGKKCVVFLAPLDVRLPEMAQADKDVFTVVQPDLIIECDRAKIDEKGARGAPVFVLEILSPSTAHKDLTTKTELYERHGVREYWIVDPVARTVTVRTLGEDDRWGTPTVHHADAMVKISSVRNLEVDLGLVFPAEPPGAGA